MQKAWVAQWNADRTQYVPHANPMPGQEVLLVCEFDNAGAPISSQVRVGWYIDGQMIGDMGVPSLVTGQKRNPARPYTFLSPGSHRYECVLDAEGRANESSESNNRQLIVVQVGPGGLPSVQPNQLSSSSGSGGLPNPGQLPTPPGPPGLGTPPAPPDQLICPAGFNRILIPAPPFVDCISDPWKEVDQVSPGCPPVPWPAQGSYVNDKSGHEDKCVAKGPLPPEIEGPTLCPPPVPGGKVEKKVQPGKDICRIFVPSPPQRTSPIAQQ
jgi:hypothetical protein